MLRKVPLDYYATQEPMPYFLTLLAHPAFSVLNPACIKAYGDSWATVQNGVFSGPFRLKSWKINDVIEVEKILIIGMLLLSVSMAFVSFNR